MDKEERHRDRANPDHRGADRQRWTRWIKNRINKILYIQYRQDFATAFGIMILSLHTDPRLVF